MKVTVDGRSPFRCGVIGTNSIESRIGGRKRTGLVWITARNDLSETTSVDSLADLLARTICYCLFMSIDHAVVCPITMQGMFHQCFLDEETLEMGHTMMEAIKNDILAVCQRDPAMDTPLQVVLFSKGFAAFVCHRAAYRLSTRTNPNLQLSTCKAKPHPPLAWTFIPMPQIGQWVMLDHGTGIVIGETAVVGDGCTLLHGVTLGGTGKQHGDRHPKIGKNVLIGANASLLGNIRIGDRVKIGAGSVVLRPIPDGATAVGDRDNKGYISINDFHERGYEALVSNTRIPSDKVREIVDLFWADNTRRSNQNNANADVAVIKYLSNYR